MGAFPRVGERPRACTPTKILTKWQLRRNGVCREGDRAFANKFMDSLQLVTIETHVADCHTCILHPAAHTHRQLSEADLLAAGIDPNLIRLSIELEDPQDLINDIANALEQAKNR